MYATVIAIPAMNEADRIGTCLRSLAGQRGAGAFATVLYANNCTDGTASVAHGWHQRLPGLHVVQATLPLPLAHAGGARSLAMQHAASLCAPDGVLMTTDADTDLPPDWVAANHAALAAGADAVAGRALIDPIEARAIPRHLHELDALECQYAALLDEIACILAPDPDDPWPRHDEHSGASIAVRLPIYQAAGGIPCLPNGEDRAFFAALRQIGARIRHAPEVAVIVSGRVDGRASGGMAETIKARMVQAPAWLDDRLEPLADRLLRLAGTPPAHSRRVAFSQVEAEIAVARTMRDRLRAGLLVEV